MNRQYSKLLWMGLLHVPIMYVFMFAMVHGSADVFMNLNTLYMAFMMAAPMVMLMPIFMKDMYKSKTLNAAAYVGSTVMIVAFFLFIRRQVLIGDSQFIRSMIPHHSGAILMCEQSKIKDSELKTLCETIVAGQQQEIDQMKAILSRIDR